MADITQLKNALREAIHADATFTALLHASNPKIQEAGSPTDLHAAFVTWRWSKTKQGNTVPGGDRYDVDLLIYAKSIASCREIGARLESHWTIPTEKPAGVSSDDYDLTQFTLRSENEAPLPVKKTADLVDVRLLVQTWRAVTRSTSAS